MSMLSQFFADITERQLMDAFYLYLTNKSSALAYILANGRNANMWKPGTNADKYEWMGSSLQPKSWVVSAELADTAQTGQFTLTLASNQKIREGFLLRFEDETDQYPIGDLQLEVVALSGTQDVTVEIYGGTTPITIPAGASVRLVSEPVIENEKNTKDGEEKKPDIEYNHFQIFRNFVEMSDTAKNSKVYGNVNSMAFQLANAFYLLEDQITEQLEHGVGIPRSSDSKSRGSFHGVRHFFTQSGGNYVDAGGSSIGKTLINDVMQMIWEKGGSANTIWCNVDQARAISAFNTSGQNPLTTMIQDSEQSRKTGGAVMQFISDIPVTKGLRANILLDPKKPRNVIDLVDLGKIALVPFQNRGMKLVDATQNGQDGETAKLITEVTLAVRDSKHTHARIDNLA